MPKRIHFLSFVLLKYVSITTSSLRSCKTPTHTPKREHISHEMRSFFFWSIEFDCRVSSSTQTAACLVEPAGRGPAAVPQRNGGERTKRKSIRATLVQSINYLQCHVVRGCRNEKTLQTVPKFTPQKDDVTLLCHDSTTQLTVGEKRIWMSPTSTRSTFILKVDIDVRMLSDEVAQFRLIATSTQDHLWLPVIS